MVLIIVSRNIDLSVGSMLGFVGYTMAMLQAESGSRRRSASASTSRTPGSSPSLFGIVARRARRRPPGRSSSRTAACPSFIVTLGGLLVWRGLIFRYEQGQTIAPLDSTFRLLGGGAAGLARRRPLSWILGVLVCVGIVYALSAGRRRARRYGFPVRPIWAEVAPRRASAAAPSWSRSWIANSYSVARGAGQRSTPRRRHPVPEAA